MGSKSDMEQTKELQLEEMELLLKEEFAAAETLWKKYENDKCLSLFSFVSNSSTYIITNPESS